MMPVSIVMPVHGRLPHLGEALQPLIEQMRRGDELVLVDNGVMERDRLRRYAAADERVRVIDARGRPSAGLARNAGAAAAHHDLLLFCDADDVAGDGYVEAVRDALATSQVVGVAESYHRLNRDRLAAQADADPVWHWGGDQRWQFVGSCALGIRREAFEAVDGFDAAIPALEDIDLCFRLTVAGVPIEGVQGPVMHIRHRGDPWAEHRRQMTHGRASVWLEARHGIRRESRLRNAFGWGWRLAQVLFTSGPRRHEAWEVLGWKRGRILGAWDIRGPGPAPAYVLADRPQSGTSRP